MSVTSVDGSSLVKVDMSMSKNAKIALAAVIITGIVCCVIAGFAVDGISGIGPMSRVFGAITLAVTVPVFLLMLALASVMKTLTLSKEQKSFKKLQKMFYDRRSECKKKANLLKQKLVVSGSFIGFSKSFPNPHCLSPETVELLEDYMCILPSIHSHILQLMQYNKGMNNDDVISFYKESMEVATAVRELAIISAIGIEKGIVDLSVLFDMRNPELNSLGVLVYYPEALALCFERELKCLDLDLTRAQTSDFTEFMVMGVLGDDENNSTRADPEKDGIKEKSLKKLEQLLLLIDKTSTTVNQFDDSYLMLLAKGRMNFKISSDYNIVINSILSSLLYHEVCSRYILDDMPEGVTFKRFNM